jgi:hypothetical protein
MAISLPKYIRARRGSYHYQRRYPTKLLHLITQKMFTYPLKLHVDTASELEVQKVTVEAEEAYQRQLSLISNSDPEAMQGTELDKAAADYLRRNNLSVGQFLRVVKNSEISVQEELEQRQLQDDGYNYADAAIPEFEDIVQKDNEGLPLTAKERVIGAA